MAFKTVSKDQPLEARPLVCVLFGTPGIGKTTLSFTATGEVLHLDFDLGIARAVQAYRPEFVDPTEYKDYGELHSAIMADEFEKFIERGGFRSIVIDTAGTLLDNFMAAWLMKVNPKNSRAGGLSLQGWGALKNEFNALLHRLRSLRLNVIIIAHEKDQGEESSSKYGLAVSGGSNDIIMASADLVGYVYHHPRDGRVVDFNPTHEHIGKNTAGLEAQKIPDASTIEYPAFLDSIFAATTAKMTEGSKAAQEVRKVLDVLFATIDEAEKAEDFDEVIEEMKGIESDTIKAQVRNRLNNAMEFKGFKYDKEAGKVVPVEEEAEA